MVRLLLLLLLISQSAWADTSNTINVEELDGSPSIFPYKIKVTNGSLTDNSDGTGTITIAAGSVSDTAYSSSWNGDTTTGASKNAIYDEVEVVRGQDDWQTVSNIVFLKVSSDNAAVGPIDSNMGKFVVSADADEVQILGRAHTTQTNNILTLEQSDGTDIFTVANDGTVTSGGSSPFFTLPTGASPTVDAVGEIALDTTANQIVYALNSSVVVAKQSQDQVCYKTYDLTASDDNELMWMAPVASQVVSVGCRMSGDVSTLATIALSDGAGNLMTHTAPTCVSGDSALTFNSVTANNALVAGEGLTFSVTNTPGSTTNEYVICAKTSETRS